jgi:hypothetical protein
MIRNAKVPTACNTVGITPYAAIQAAHSARGGRSMKVLIATLGLLVSSPVVAQECKSCTEADACIQTYGKAVSTAQRATKVAIRDWQQNLDKKASAEFSSRGMAALQSVLDSQVRSELEKLRECLAKIK